MKIKNLSTMIAVVLIATLFGFLPTYGQNYTSAQIDSAITYRGITDYPVTEDELLNALELAHIYLNREYSNVTTLPNLLYIDEPTRLRMMADEIEQKEKDLVYIDDIRVRLALYGIVKSKNSK